MLAHFMVLLLSLKYSLIYALGVLGFHYFICMCLEGVVEYSSLVIILRGNDTMMCASKCSSCLIGCGEEC